MKEILKVPSDYQLRLLELRVQLIEEVLLSRGDITSKELEERFSVKFLSLIKELKGNVDE